MTSSSNMIITNLGLTNIARRLIEERTLIQEDIQLVGHPLLTDTGKLSCITESSYALCKNINFDADRVDDLQFTFKGVVGDIDENYQTCLTLIQESDSQYNVSLSINKDSFRIQSGTTDVITIDNLNFKKNDLIEFYLFLWDDNMYIDLSLNGNYSHYEGQPGSLHYGSLASRDFKVLAAGYNPLKTDEYWKGSIDLTRIVVNFTMYTSENPDDWIYYEYVPSRYATFEFTKVLISDSTMDLKDDSIAVFKHIYEFDVGRDKGGIGYIGLQVEIGENVYLTINKIGLYAKDEKGNQFLFGLVDGLSLQKKKDIGYELVFYVNIHIGVVNTQIRPEIIVKDGEYANRAQLEKLKLIHADVVTDMERAINNNATILGYEQDTTSYLLFNQTRFANANFAGVHEYSRVLQQLSPKKLRTFNPEKVVIVGEPFVSGSIIKNITTSNYVEVDFNAVLDDNWELEVAFQMLKSSQAQTILCLNNPNVGTALTLGADNDSKIYVRTNTGVLEELSEVHDLKKTFIKIKYNGTSYTFYERLSTEPTYRKLKEVASATPLGEIDFGYVGVANNNGSIVDPLIGTIDMNEIILYSDGEDFSPSIVEERYIKTEDFYNIIDYPASFYKINNLKPLAGSQLVYLEGSLTGNRDSLDFGSSRGGSITLKVNLDGEKGTFGGIFILGKTKVEEVDGELVPEHYFTLEFKNYTLIATIYLVNDIIELKKEYDVDSCNELVEYPVTITITSNNSGEEPVFAMYINTEKVDEQPGLTFDYLPPISYEFTNYELNKEEATKNYVSFIASFDGTLNESDIRYLCNLLGTSF